MPAIKQEPDVREPLADAPPFEDTRPGVRDEGLARRFAWGLGVSVAVNLVVWQVASGIVHSRIITPPIPITIERIVLPPKPKHVVVKPRHIEKPRPKPPVKPLPRPLPKPAPQHHVVVPHPTPHPPPPAHNRVITAPGPAAPTDHTALPGGNAGVGKPVEHQYAGNGTDTNARPQPPAPTPPPPAPKPEPPAPAPPPPAPKPEPPAPKPPPPPPPGPTQDAQPDNQVNPEIPDDLREQTFKTHVRVKVDIHADGSFTPSLITSSGNADIDNLVLQALRKWRWKPALKDGKPVDSTQRFRFDFEVQ